jgi:hypothetical protein
MEFLFENQYFWTIQSIFTICMLLDAYRRRVDWFWFLVILVVQPIGAWVYFVVIMLGSMRNPLRSRGGWSWKRRPSIAELRHRTERAPTVVNHFTLAECLMSKRQFDDAVSHLQAAIALDPEYCPAQYALAVCHHERGEPAAAVQPLEKIIARDRKWSNYRAWRLLIEVRTVQSDKAGALAACRELAKMMPTFQYKCRLGGLLVANGECDEAAKLMEQALEDYRFEPFGVRLRDRRWAKEAHRLWQQAEQEKSKRQA